MLPLCDRRYGAPGSAASVQANNMTRNMTGTLMKSAGLALFCVLSSLAFAAPPAPRITVAASDIKQLTFEWPSVAGATRYELWFKASDATPWVEYTEKTAPRTSLNISVSVHLLEWPQARYQLKACNSTGCSTSNTVRVNHDEKLVAMGYLKPNDTSHAFGGIVALSADGQTLAVLSQAVGPPIGAVIHVYRKSVAGWRFEARLDDGMTGYTGVNLGNPLAVSGNGNLIALGMAYDAEFDPEGYNVGYVQLFRRSGSTWRTAQRLAGIGRSFDEFGHDVSLDDAGRTLAITHSYPDATTEDGESGIVEIYRDAPNDNSDQFLHQTTLRTPVVSGATAQCGGIALSGDGQTLLRGCFARTSTNEVRMVEVMEAPGWTVTSTLPGVDLNAFDISYDGSVVLLQAEGAALVMRLGASGWVQEAGLTTFGGFFSGGHRSIALSRDGRFAALGPISDVAAGLGPIFPPYQTGQNETGAVILHERRSTGWVVRRLIKPGSTQIQWAGHSVALGDNGRVLATGAPYEASAASGINGDREDESAWGRGAVWLY